MELLINSRTTRRLSHARTQRQQLISPSLGVYRTGASRVRVRTGGACGCGTGIVASQVYVPVYGTAVDPLSIHPDARSTLWPAAGQAEHLVEGRSCTWWKREESRVRHQP